MADTYRDISSYFLNPVTKIELGQYFTPAVTARLMASWVSSTEDVNILDAGAGVGSLTAACVESLIVRPYPPRNIHVSAYEIDINLIPLLRSILNECAQHCLKANINFSFNIEHGDFINKSTSFISGQTKLFDQNCHNWNLAILNPPYRKINVNSSERLMLHQSGIETSNLYAGFLWLACKMLDDNGVLVAITPRSFCNGPYFLPFRRTFLKDFKLERIHLFNARNQIFSDDDVLQENIIFKAYKKKGTSIDKPVLISTSLSPNDLFITERLLKHQDIVNPNDPELFIHITPDNSGHQIKELINSLSNTLATLGLAVSTGKVVDFRIKNLLCNQPLDAKSNTLIIPLIYPSNLVNSGVVWPIHNNKKPNSIIKNAETNPLLVESGFYVLVKRFSSKEEKKRVVASVYDPTLFSSMQIGFENHLNYFHQNGKGFEQDLAKGLAAYLNSTYVDQYFRQFNGHTQVNATDLRNLKYPSTAQLIKIGRSLSNIGLTQSEIDQIIDENLKMAKINQTENPIQNRKKIEETLSVLIKLNLPRELQNERSALVLLALLNLKPATPWQNVMSPLLGVTEIMNFIRDYFGINYAPNTRETFRRFTLHQFIQLGLVQINPDNLKRPINSPKTCYQLNEDIVNLLRSFNTKIWDSTVLSYIASHPKLHLLTPQPHKTSFIPVTLPNGDKIELSEGGQNPLLKNIIEQFCPQFTPGGIIIYMGDTGQKIRGSEIKYLQNLGIYLDEHGKMPDLIIHLLEKDWLVIVEAVTSHGPINIKRHNELKDLFKNSKAGLVFVTAFETRKAMTQYLKDIAWETDVWIAESPSHLIHFNGERFLGPYR
ncbi:MAG: Eco57I restriction-modification methylase domain-containing protein [Chloroflexi bacterium]|nr:Eco57I restriction-modification methylase domain-containing protein [Chloroflexota bacterium]